MAASESQIADVEHHFGLQLPADYRRFLLTQGTVGTFLPPSNAYVNVYPVEEVIGVNQAGFIQERFPEALVIGSDGSREMLTYDFRQDPPTLVLLDITAEDWSAAIYQASSLTSLLDQLPDSGWRFQ